MTLGDSKTVGILVPSSEGFAIFSGMETFLGAVIAGVISFVFVLVDAVFKTAAGVVVGAEGEMHEEAWLGVV